MRTIGILGGMNWESTAEYYRRMNEQVKDRMGGLHSAQIVMVSVDFHPLEEWMRVGEWQKIGDRLVEGAKALQAGGADFIVLATNTMHKLCDRIESAIDIPFLHIADATAAELAEAGIGTVGLLGTAITMEDSFYRGRLEEKHGLTVLVPNEDDRRLVNRVIFEELVLGSIREDSRREYIRIIESLKEQGAEGCILGCTEIGLLVGANDCSIPTFDTATIHADRAVNRALDIDES